MGSKCSYYLHLTDEGTEAPGGYVTVQDHTASDSRAGSQTQAVWLQHLCSQGLLRTGTAIEPKWVGEWTTGHMWWPQHGCPQDAWAPNAHRSSLAWNLHLQSPLSL